MQNLEISTESCYRRDAKISTAEKNPILQPNILSLCDNASCKLAFNDAAEFGNSAERGKKDISNNLSIFGKIFLEFYQKK